MEGAGVVARSFRMYRAGLERAGQSGNISLAMIFLEQNMTAYLVDEDSAEQYQVTEPVCKVGSNPPSNIVLSAPDVAPVHVRIELKGNDYFAALEPGAASTRKFLFLFDIPTAKHNGSALEGRPSKLADGDKLQVGSKLLHFRRV